MQLLRDLVLRRKLLLVMMLSSCLTLGVACAAWFYGDWTSSRTAQERQLTLLAEVIGTSVTPALASGDRAAIETSLLTLARRPSIRRAAVFDLHGEVLACTSQEQGLAGLAYREQGAELLPEGLSVYVPVQAGGQRVGTVGIESDLAELRERQLAFGLAGMIVLAVCLLVAFALSCRLQAFISEPVLRLAETVREIARRGDYSLRARKLGRDELGDLADSFNTMLAAIEERDARLEQNRVTLEEQVAQRTHELTEKNARLQESMEEARAATEAKARFLANMSHEIRTPMNGVLGMNELLLESGLDAQQKSYAEIVRSSAEALLEIINDILDFSKIEAGKLSLETIQFDLHRTVSEVIGLLSGVAHKKRLELRLEVQPDVPRAVCGDPTRLRQVLINLLGNALKFTEQGRVGLRVECLEELEQAARLRFVIEDTGIGIDRERQRILFEPFTQVDSSATRRHGGTGLGLAISKELVALMGGEIGLKSELGQGSTFWFSANLGLLPEGTLTSPLASAGAPPRVLIGDPSAAAREMLHQQMSAWGFEHEVAGDVARALAALRRAQAGERAFGLLLLDAELCASPELAACLRDELGPRPPKVVGLRWPGAGAGDAHLACIPDATLAKPVRPSELFDALMQVLDGEQALTLGGPLERGDEALSVAPTPLRILLAEDNLINQTVASKILAKGRHVCAVVADGRSAVAAVRAGDFDAVLMDCQMPELDGFEATRAIRAHEREQGGRRVHVIALTANAMLGDRERCLAAGMDDYLSKPVKPELLLAKLAELARRLREPSAPFGSGQQSSGGAAEPFAAGAGREGRRA